MADKTTSKAVTPGAKPRTVKNQPPASTAKPKRSSTKTVSKRPVAAKAPATKSAVAKSPNLKIDTTATGGEVERPDIPKKELVQRMVDETGMKAGEARRALDAVLSVLASGLREGADISAAPLGKIKIIRSKETANGDLVVCRIKLKDAKQSVDQDAPTTPSEI